MPIDRHGGGQRVKTVVAIRHDGMGLGDAELGDRILRTFLSKIGTGLAGLDTIVCYNGGVRLLAEGSSCLQALAALEQRGIDVIACGTCVDHFDLRGQLRVGEIGSMDLIIAALAAANKVISP
jgi:selenium metabolism protein YedF